MKYKQTHSLDFKILNCILEYNVNFDFPKLADILAKINFTSRNTVEVALTNLKRQGLVATKGYTSSYGYYVTEAGVDRIKSLEINETKDKLLQLYNEMFPLGD